MDLKAQQKTLPIKLATWNANGLQNKMSEFIDFIDNYKPDIIAVTETHAKQQHKLKVPRYEQYRTDRADRYGGGTSIYINKNLNSTLYSTTNADYEQTSVIVELPNGQKIKIISMYNPPDCIPSRDTFQSLFSDNMDTIMMGDLNSKIKEWGCKNDNRNGHHLYTILHDLNLALYAPSECTYFPHFINHKPDILDVMVTNMPNLFTSQTVTTLNSDHVPVIFTTNINIDKKVDTKSRTDWTLFENVLRTTELDIGELNDKTAIDNAVLKITEYLQDAFDHATEVRPVKDKYWKLPNSIKTLIKDKNKVKKEWYLNKSPLTKNQLNRLERKIKEISKAHKEKMWNHQVENLTTDNNSIWKMAKTLRASKTTNLPLIGPNGPVYANKDKLEILANSLENQFSQNDYPANSHHNDTIKTYNDIINNTDLLNTMEPVTTQEVIAIIKKLKNNKAPGMDNVNNKMMKATPEKFLTAITKIYNACIEQSYFPDQWKTSTIVLFPKPGKDISKPENHRPISLLPTLSKIFERLILKRLLPYINLPSQQYGFRKGLCTTKQLLRLIDFITKGLFNKNATALLLLDVAKAFDRVWFEGLIVKLHKQGVPMDIIHLINSYITNRRFKVKLNGKFSEEKPIKAGVPQGSILGPLLYIIYNSDFPIFETRNEFTAFYADDTALAYKSLQANHAVRKLQNNLKQVEQWCHNWKVLINADKSNLIIIRRNKTKVEITEKLMLFNKAIPLTNKAKYLGITIDSKLRWHNHINETLQKARKGFYALYPLLNPNSKMDIVNKRTLYLMCIRPIITYASPIWSYIPITTKKKLDRFQSKILRIMTNAPICIRTKRLHDELKIDLLSEYIEKLNAGFFKKATSCTTADFNKIFNIELVTTMDYNPIVRFFLTDATLSSHYT